MSQLYPRKFLRVRAYLLDCCAVFAIGASGVYLLQLLVSDDRVRRVGWFGIAAAALAYEPILVWGTGATVGHRLTNLRVVSQGSRNSLSLLRAILRAITKVTLGWLSFLVMLITGRGKAIHDALTQSDVVLRNPTLARPGQYRSQQDLERERNRSASPDGEVSDPWP